MAYESDEDSILQKCVTEARQGIFQVLATILIFLCSAITGMMVTADSLTTADIPFYCSNSNDSFDALQLSQKYDEYLCFTPNTTQWCDGTYVFVPQDTGMHSTLISTFELVCERRFYKSLIRSVKMVGMVLGIATLGRASDKFGRKPILIFSLCVLATCTFINSFAPNMYVFIVVKFILSLFLITCYLSSFIIIAEFTQKKHRLILCIWLESLFGIGTLLLGYPIGYFIRDWRNVLRITSLIVFLIIPPFFWVPESTTWLIANGYNERALKEFKRIASWNGGSISQETERELLEFKQKGESNSDISRFLKNRIFMTFIAIQIYLWVTVNLNFYGLTFAAGDSTQMSLFANLAVSGFMETPGVILCFFLLYIGRRQAMIVTLIGAACVCMLSSFFSGTWNLILIQIGKMFSSGSFIGVYVYSSELNPTLVRSTFMGLCSCLARFGGVIAPFIGQIGEAYWPPLTLVIFSLVGFLGALLTMFLPETLGKNLPNNYEDFVLSIQERKPIEKKKVNYS